MKFYIASGLQNKDTVKQVSRHLREKGHHHTYDWTKNNRAETFERLTEIGEEEKKGVIEADVLIALLPGGKGTHIEIGMAIGMNKQVYIYNESTISPTSSCAFYHINGVTMYSGTIHDFLNDIEGDLA